MVGGRRVVMKKLLGILVLGLLWCGTANAGITEPGKINSLACTIGALEAYNEAQDYLKKIQFFYSQNQK